MSESKQLTIIQMNDIHGYYNNHPEMFFEDGQEVYRNAGGFSRIASILNEVRHNHPDSVLALDNGDTFHGTYPVVKTKGEGLIPILNELAFDGMTAHWDFAYGPKQLAKLANHLSYPLLACNCYLKETDELMFSPYKIVERAGLKIGIIGIAQHIIDKMMPSSFSEVVYFTLGTKEVAREVTTLREKNVDLIVVLSHFGFPQEVKLAKEVDGIDILLSGHTHNALEEALIVNDTILMQSGCHGAHLGRLNITVKDQKITGFSHELIEVKEEIPPDESIEKKLAELTAPYQQQLAEVIGETKTALHRYRQLETTMDNFLLQALLDTTDAEIAFSNGWRYGAPIPVGPITMNDLWNIIPPNPPVSTVELTGAEILEMLEENLENTFSSDPYQQMGGYVKRCLGLKMFVKLENPNGMRIQHLFIGNKKVERNQVYKVGFVTVQGVPLKYGKNRKNLAIHAIDAMCAYVEKVQKVEAELRGTIEII